MTRYALNLPPQLKTEAERLADEQGISLNQFILWSVAEKVAALRSGLDDPNYPHVTYRRGASGLPTPILRGTGIRVQTLVIESQEEGLKPQEIAEEHGLPERQVMEVLAFYQAHRAEIDLSIEAEETLEAARG